MALDDVKTACAAGGIRVLRDFSGFLLLTTQGVQAIVNLQSRGLALTSAFSEKGDTFQLVEVSRLK